METSTQKMPEKVPPQHQDKQPGIEEKMRPQPIYDNDEPGNDRLKDKVAIITGGDSGIGRAVAIAFAKEGADIAIVYLDEHEDAKKTAAEVSKYGRKALLIPTDISVEQNCKVAVDKTLEKFNRIDILINNAAVQYPQEQIEDITAEQLEKASITAYRGSEKLLDYSSTKGAVVAFTRSLSTSLVQRGIRVNAVAPGPVWTPLIPSSFDKKKVAEFGTDTAIGRVAQPVEIAPAYVFLASKEGVFFTGQVLHPNGGSIVNT